MPPVVTGLLLTALAFGDPSLAETPVEFGRVRWMHDVDAAFVEAQQSGRPVALLFQEVPGCSTCVAYGRGPLSHPLLVDAFHELFVPAAVRNNVPGPEAAVRARFGEPAWNNPVLRLFGADGGELLPRRADAYGEDEVAALLVDGLRAAGRDVPAWLELALQESRARGARRATFAMDCFWEGEAALGSLDGVVATRPGWLDGREVVEVLYLPDVLDDAALFAAARTERCTRRVHVPEASQASAARAALGDVVEQSEQRASAAEASDALHSLAGSRLRWLPLTPIQAVRVNAALARGDDPSRFVSPRQLSQLALLDAALARDADACEGLQRPADVTSLADYERELAARLRPSPAASGEGEHTSTSPAGGD